MYGTDQYNYLLRSLISQFYRSDGQGPLFQRMDTLANFIHKYNSDRNNVKSTTKQFISNYILPMSKKLSQQLGVVSIPPVTLNFPNCTNS